MYIPSTFWMVLFRLCKTVAIVYVLPETQFSPFSVNDWLIIIQLLFNSSHAGVKTTVAFCHRVRPRTAFTTPKPPYFCPPDTPHFNVFISEWHLTPSHWEATAVTTHPATPRTKWGCTINAPIAQSLKYETASNSPTEDLPLACTTPPQRDQQDQPARTVQTPLAL